jgi:phosphate transport system substrate-binding protein
VTLLEEPVANQSITNRKGFLLIRNRLLGLIIATVGTMGCMAGVSTAIASANLTGAGSSLIAPLMGNWINGFEAAGHGNVKVTYGSVGSGAGIAQITNRTVDFGASDAPLTPEQAAACNGCVQIPWALTATGIGFSVPGVKKLNLTGPILAGIYFGKITNWSDPKITKINPKAHLPNLAITPVFRSDGSGDTYAFTNYLSKVSKSWKSEVGYATSVGFTHGVGAKGNSGVTNVVASTAGAIGYISASYLIAAGLPVAALKNEAGNYEYPNLKNITNAAEMVKSVPSSNELHIVNPPKKFSIAYPLSTFTYAIVPHNAPQKGLVSEFVNYAMTTGQKYGAALDFAPLPKVVLTAAKTAVAGL